MQGIVNEMQMFYGKVTAQELALPRTLLSLPTPCKRHLRAPLARRKTTTPYIHSIIIIQSVIRRFLVLQKYKKLQVSVIKLQSLYRGYKARLVYDKIVYSLVKIQATTRMWLTRKRFLKQRKSIIKLQSLARMYIQRRRHTTYLNSCIRLQRLWRRKQQKQRELALIVSLQTLVRMRRQRLKYMRILLSCVTIQRWWRRKVFEKNVSKIQSVIRMWMQRKIYTKCIRSCIVLQRIWRSKRLLKNAIKIQSFFRMWKQRKSYLHTIYKLIKIQNVFRMWKQRKSYLHTISKLIKIQSILRMWKYRILFIKKQRNVVKIQSIVRMFIYRRRYQKRTELIPSQQPHPQLPQITKTKTPSKIPIISPKIPSKIPIFSPKPPILLPPQAQSQNTLGTSLSSLSIEEKTRILNEIRIKKQLLSSSASSHTAVTLHSPMVQNFNTPSSSNDINQATYHPTTSSSVQHIQNDISARRSQRLVEDSSSNSPPLRKLIIIPPTKPIPNPEPEKTPYQLISTLSSPDLTKLTRMNTSRNQNLPGKPTKIRVIVRKEGERPPSPNAKVTRFFAEREFRLTDDKVEEQSCSSFSKVRFKDLISTEMEEQFECRDGMKSLLKRKRKVFPEIVEGERVEIQKMVYDGEFVREERGARDSLIKKKAGRKKK